MGLIVLLLGTIIVVVIPRFEIPYHVYIAPLGAITSAALLVEFWNTKSWMKRSIATLFLGAWLLNGVLVFGFLNFSFHSTLAGKADYDEFCQMVSTCLPAGAKVCGWGTPCIYWGLNRERPDVQFRDRAFIDSAKANDIVREIGYVVLSRGFTPEQDEIGLKKQYDTFSILCALNQRQLMRVATVGNKLKYAYSADIYRVVPLADE
jgi:hypothetical protein